MRSWSHATRDGGRWWSDRHEACRGLRKFHADGWQEASDRAPAGERGCRQWAVDQHRRLLSASLGRSGAEVRVLIGVHALPGIFTRVLQGRNAPETPGWFAARTHRGRVAAHPPALEGGAGEEGECRSRTSMHGKRPLDIPGLDVPVVLAGRPFRDDASLSYVDADNVGGAKMAVRYLLERGRRTVATVAGPAHMSPGVDRLRGYRMAMADAGLSDSGLTMFGDFGRVSAEHAVYRLLDRRPALDAVFAASELMAAGVLRALRKSGRRVPDDVAVVGFEDSPLARHINPKLTAVRQPVEAMGERLARELLALIARGGREPVQTVLETELLIRESALRPAEKGRLAWWSQRSVVARSTRRPRRHMRLQC